MSKISQLFGSFFRSSLLWGGLASLGFYGLIHNGTLEGEFFERYFSAHWCLYVETIMFFVGVAELLLKTFDLGDQTARLHKPLLGARPEKPHPIADVPQLIKQLLELPAKDQHGYMPRRLREALDAIRRKGSADGLDEELKYLSEVDAARAHSGYAFMRIIIWAIPILGFLGTVIGITIAIASLNPKALEQSLDAVTGGLGVAFDTTALALVLSMILMFGQYVVDKREGKLLSEVDNRAFDELTGRFEVTGTSSDPQVALMQRLAEVVQQSTEKLVQKQAEIWQKSIDAANRRFGEIATSAQQQVEAALVKAIGKSVQSHAEQMATAEATAAERNRRHWSRVHKALVESSQVAQAQHVELAKQGAVLLQVVEATGQITKLEDTLNHNLAALAGAQHFQETLLNLTAAIHLLNARLGQVAPMSPHVGLKEVTVSKAA